MLLSTPYLGEAPTDRRWNRWRAEQQLALSRAPACARACPRVRVTCVCPAGLSRSTYLSAVSGVRYLLGLMKTLANTGHLSQGSRRVLNKGQGRPPRRSTWTHPGLGRSTHPGPESQQGRGHGGSCCGRARGIPLTDFSQNLRALSGSPVSDTNTCG